MIALLLLSCTLQALLQTATSTCSEEDFAKFYKCANEKTDLDYAELREKKLDKVASEEIRMQSCVTNAGCSVKIDFATRWYTFIQPSPLDETFALIQKFWNAQHAIMQQCELSKSLDPLNQLVAQCVQKKYPEFKLPEKMPDPAVPPADMLKNELPLVQRYMENRISAIVQTNQCGEKTNSVHNCIADNEAKGIAKCVQNNLCQSPSCAPIYNELRLTIQSCFNEVIPDYTKPFSVLEEVDQTKAIEVLTLCENRARGVSGNAQFKFNRHDAKVIYNKDTTVIAGGLGAKFRQATKSLMDAYVNSESFLDYPCEGSKVRRQKFLHKATH